MHVHLFTITCPECGNTTRTRARSSFECSSCGASLTLEDITILQMERCEIFEDALLMTS